MGRPRTITLAIAGMLAFGSASARADVVLPFSLQGLFIYTQSGPSQIPSLFTATLLIDTTTGTVQDFRSSSFNNPMFPRQGSIAGSGTYFWSALFDYVPTSVNLVFGTPSLIGYTGGSLVSVSQPDATGNYTFINEVHVPPRVLVSGSVTPLPVPEPASIASLAVGALAAATVRRWGSRLIRSRRRRARSSFDVEGAAAV